MCISSQNPLDVNKDYFPANTRLAKDGAIAGTATVTYAGDFSITYHKHFKVVKNLKMSPPTVYILRICGSDAPTKYPDGTAIEAGAKHFSVPVKGVAVGWSTPYAALELLGLELVRLGFVRNDVERSCPTVNVRRQIASQGRAAEAGAQGAGPSSGSGAGCIPAGQPASLHLQDMRTFLGNVGETNSIF